MQLRLHPVGPAVSKIAYALFLPLVTRLVIPIQRLMLHLRSSLLQLPPKGKLDILHQMARQLYMPHISRMIKWANIVVLKNSSSVEVMNKALPTELVQRAVFGEMPDDSLDLGGEASGLAVGVADLVCTNISRNEGT